MKSQLSHVALAVVLCLFVGFSACGGGSPISPTTPGTGGTGGAPPPTPPPGDGNTSTWQPALKTSWQWQLSTLPSPGSLLDVEMYDVDGFNADEALITAMHARHIHAVCYLSLGTFEDWRPDAGSFPSSVLGSGNGWPGEKWLDIRQIGALSPIMTARFQMCKDKGFDAVEPDNIDGYSNSTGFPLKATDQIAYNKWIATTVHSMGMSVALKNDLEQVSDLVSAFDFAINEECFEFSECNMLTPFIDANKAVFEVEYSLSTSQFCPEANAMNFNALKKDLDLTDIVTACR